MFKIITVTLALVACATAAPGLALGGGPALLGGHYAAPGLLGGHYAAPSLSLAHAAPAISYAHTAPAISYAAAPITKIGSIAPLSPYGGPLGLGLGHGGYISPAITKYSAAPLAHAAYASPYGLAAPALAHGW